MKPEDKSAFEARYSGKGFSIEQEVFAERVWRSCCEHRDKQAAQAEPVGNVSRDSSIAHMRVNLPEGTQLFANSQPAVAPVQQDPVASQKDAVFDASIEFIETLTGMKPPPIEVAPPEVFEPFRVFTEKVCAIFSENKPFPPAPVQQEPVADYGRIYTWVYVDKYGIDSKPAAKEWCEEMIGLHGGSMFALYTEAPAVAHPPAEVVRELVEALDQIHDEARARAKHKDGVNPTWILNITQNSLTKAKEHGL